MRSLSFLGLFLFLRQETKHPEETIGSLSLFVPIGGGGWFLFLFFCFVCLLYFHSVTLSPIFFEKSRCII